MAYRHFVVRQEGDEYEYMSKRRWLRERRLVPIYGTRAGGKLRIYDRILKSHGQNPIRIRQVPSMTWEQLAKREHAAFKAILAGK